MSKVGRRSHSGNPFPGPRPYRSEDRERFRGRTKVAHSLRHTIMAYRCVALYGPSGAGKSSIMQAAVIPELEDEHSFRRVLIDRWPQSEEPLHWIHDALYAQLDLHIRSKGKDFDAFASIDDVIERAFRRSDHPILVYLDQLEQLLYADRDLAQVEEMLDWLDAFVEHPVRGLHVVIALREDYLGRFRDRARGCYRLLENGFRLGPMTVNEIVPAVREAAVRGDPPQQWREDTIRQLMRQVVTPGQSEGDHAEVQAAFAQLVCRALFAEPHEQLQLHGTAAATQVGIEAKPIFERYLETTLGELGDLRGPAEELLEDRLIVEGNRALLTEEAARAYFHGKQSVDAIDTILKHLENAAILRAEQNRGSRFFELGHDWLANEVIARKQARVALREENRRLQIADAKLAAANEKKRVWRISAYVLGAMVAAFVVLIIRIVGQEKTLNAQEKTLNAQKKELEKVDEELGEKEKRLKIAKEALDKLNEEKQKENEALDKLNEEKQKEKNELGRVKKELDKLKINLSNSQDKLRRNQQELLKKDESLRSKNKQLEVRRRQAQNATRIAAARGRDRDNDPTAMLVLLSEFEEVENVEVWKEEVCKALCLPVSRIIVRYDNVRELKEDAPSNKKRWVGVAFPQKEVIVTTSSDEALRFKDLDKGGVRKAASESKQPQGVTAMVVSKTGVIATVSKVGLLQLWGPDGASRGEPLVCSEESNNKGCSDLTGATLAINEDGTRLAAGMRSGQVIVWRTSALGQPHRLKPHKQAIRSVTFGRDPKKKLDVLATGSDDGWIHVWEWRDKTPTPTAALSPKRFLHRGTVYNVAIDRNGELVASAGDDGSARVWAIEDKKRKFRLQHAESVYSVDFDPSSDRIVTASADSTAKIWSLGGSEYCAEYSLEAEGAGKIYVARFSPSGDRVATASQDNVARIWDTSSGAASLGTCAKRKPKPKHEFYGHTGPLFDVQFSRDGRLATTSKDKTVRVWDATNPWRGGENRGCENTCKDREYGEIRNQIRKKTNVCLTKREREDYLGEEPADADRNSQTCRKNPRGWFGPPAPHAN